MTPSPPRRAPWAWVAVAGGLIGLLISLCAVAAYLGDTRYATPLVAKAIAQEVCDARCQSKAEAAEAAKANAAEHKVIQLEVADRLARIETTLEAVQKLLEQQAHAAQARRRP